VSVFKASNITVQSVNGPEVTVVNANYPYFTNRCFLLTSNAVVSGFTITNGRVKDLALNTGGGGVLINGSGRVTNCWITGNSTTNDMPIDINSSNGGGGVRCKGGGEVFNCRIYANSSTGGSLAAAVYANGAGNYTIRDCVLSNNNSSGYAVYTVTTVSVANCAFINNSAKGLVMWPALDFSVDDCQMIGNSNEGCYVSRGIGVVRNCQMSNNGGSGIQTTSMDSGIISNCMSANNGGYGIVTGNNKPNLLGLIIPKENPPGKSHNN